MFFLRPASQIPRPAMIGGMIKVGEDEAFTMSNVTIFTIYFVYSVKPSLTIKLVNGAQALITKLEW